MQPASSPSHHADTVEDRSARVAEMMTRYLGEHVMHGFADDDVTEIYVNPQDGLIRFDTRRRGKVSSGERIEAQRVEQFLNAVADLHGLALGGEHPQVQAELPRERFRGARLQGFLPPMAAGASFIVRKPPSVIYPLDEYVERGILSAGGRETLREAARAHWNILIAGGTGSGKTTFANALLKEITDLCPSERIVILEDTVELQCEAADHLALRTTATVSLARLVRHTLRAYPDRIVVGEVRGPEALDLLDAWSTGHPGGLGTFHAQDAAGTLLRLDRLCQRANVPSQVELIAEAVDLIAVMEGGHQGRRVKDLVRVLGLKGDGSFHLESLSAGTDGAGNEALAPEEEIASTYHTHDLTKVPMQNKTPTRKPSRIHPALKVAGLFGLALLVFLLPLEVVAGTGGTDLPWNTPLQNLLDNMTGTTARILAGMMLVVGGIVWGFTRNEEGAKRFGQAIVAIALMFGAVQIVDALAFAGAVM